MRTEQMFHVQSSLTYSSINNAELPSDVKLVKDKRDGLYDIKVVAKLHKSTLKPDTIINCQLSIPRTDYKKNQKTVYFGE
jgi:hypothetical protein